ITVLLSYIRDKVRYQALRSFLEDHMIAKIEYMNIHCPNDAETLILFLDIITCPYVTDATRLRIGSMFQLDAAGISSIQSINGQWFTAWGDKMNLERELDAKRSREVY